MWGHWRSVVRGGIALVTAMGCSTSDPDGPPEPRRCEQLRDHVVDLKIGEAKGVSASDLAQHREAMRDALGSTFLSACTAKLTERQVACALGAMDDSGLSACTSSTAH